MPQNGWNVYLGERLIDTVFYDADMEADEVKRSLVGHDGYDQSIEVTTEERGDEMDPISDTERTERGGKIVALLWDYLRADPGHKDRKQTGWGTKTKEGLVSCLDRIYREGE